MLRELLNQQFDQQYRRPSGLLGRYIGRRMAHDHAPENRWTIAVLDPKPGEHMLELGFGPGVAIRALSRLVTPGTVSGIDFSITMVQAARRRNARAVQQGRVRLYHGDVAALPFADASFDKAYSIHSIYFWPHPLVALQEVLRVLRPGGSLTLTVLPRERWNESDPAAPVGTPQCRPYAGDELRQLLATAGFRATQILADSDRALRSNYSVVGIKR